MKAQLKFKSVIFLIALSGLYPACIAAQNIPAQTETNSRYAKANRLQILNYKPARAKAGKNGGERFVLIQLGKGPKSGQTGREGKAGPALKVYISRIVLGDTDLLKITVNAGTKTDSFFLNPRYGQVKIMADGGDGGTGGRGEQGGGTNASGGRGGDGGSMEVLFDEGASKYYNCTCLVYSNEGGAGGWSADNTARQAEAGKKGPAILLKKENGLLLGEVKSEK